MDSSLSFGKATFLRWALSTPGEPVILERRTLLAWTVVADLPVLGPLELGAEHGAVSDAVRHDDRTRRERTSVHAAVHYHRQPAAN